MGEHLNKPLRVGRSQLGFRVVKFLGGNDGFLSGGKVGTLRKIEVLSIEGDKMLSSE